MEPLVNGAGLMSTYSASQFWTTPVVPELSLHTVEVADLAQQPTGDERVLVTRLVKLPSGVRPAGRELDVLFVAGEAGVCGVPIALHRAPEVNG